MLTAPAAMLTSTFGMKKGLSRRTLPPSCTRRAAIGASKPGQRVQPSGLWPLASCPALLLSPFASLGECRALPACGFQGWERRASDKCGVHGCSCCLTDLDEAAHPTCQCPPAAAQHPACSTYCTAAALLSTTQPTHHQRHPPTAPTSSTPASAMSVVQLMPAPSATPVACRSASLCGAQPASCRACGAAPAGKQGHGGESTGSACARPYSGGPKGWSWHGRLRSARPGAAAVTKTR